MVLALVLAACLFVPVDVGLEDFYSACLSWSPYSAIIKRVRWCEPIECYHMQHVAVGWWRAEQQNVVIFRWPDGTYPKNAEGDLKLVLIHEYGHALGLPHSSNGIMKPNWEEPVAQGPEARDFEILRRMQEWRDGL
jgi:hypothetical protein